MNQTTVNVVISYWLLVTDPSPVRSLQSQILHTEQKGKSWIKLISQEKSTSLSQNKCRPLWPKFAQIAVVAACLSLISNILQLDFRGMEDIKIGKGTER